MKSECQIKEAATYRAEIFIAGDYAAAITACREFVMEGLCVSVSPCDFVYTGGMESGVRVLLINYPRFPASEEIVFDSAVRLARFLIVRLFQTSASVVADGKTIWLTRRDS